MKGANSDATFKELKVVWHSDRGKKKQKSQHYELHPDLLHVIAQKLAGKGFENFSLVGYTAMTTQFEDRTYIFRANPYYKESQRYGCAYVEYASKDPRTGLTTKTCEYPALVLGFVCLPGDVQVSAVIRNSTNPVSWEQ